MDLKGRTVADAASAQPRPPARILIVDDHPIVRLGIRQMIAGNPGLAVCGEADTAASALRLMPTLTPDLAIVDLSLEDRSGLALIRSLRELAPGIRILVLSVHDEALFAEHALRAGADGYIMKEEAIDGLERAIQEVLAGRRFVSPNMSQRMLERVGHDAGRMASPLEALTARELEVFELIGRGVGTTSIADRLNVSVKTIETYRSNIKVKLGLRNATELTRFSVAWTER